jgi:hypothetical protein
VLPPAGCFSDQKQQLAQCELDAQRVYPKDGDEGRRMNYLPTCMAAHGYEGNMADNKCGHLPNIYADFEHNPYCYTPTNRIARWVYRVETSEVDE